MDIKISRKKPELFDGDLVVYLARQNEEGLPTIGATNREIDALLDRSFSFGDFQGKEGQSISLYPESARGKSGLSHRARRVMLLGLGDGEVTLETLRKAAGEIGTLLKKVSAPKIMLVPDCESSLKSASQAQALVEGVILGGYRFSGYKSDSDEDKSAPLESITLFSQRPPANLRAGAKQGSISAQAACKARDMANEPGNNWTPKHFAEYSLKIAKRHGLVRKVLGKSEIARLKMGGLLGVNQGTSEPPKLVTLEYRTGRDVPCLLLVGKGLTFDSGGISLKPSAGMEDMKYDMCGGAAVLAAMDAVGTMAPENVDVVCVVPATDNMPGPGALKPGDVIRQYNGKSVEIISTDAEGRLILADALAYGIKEYEPDAVIDLATLTGAVIVGLGHHMTGLMSNDERLAHRLLRAGERSGEPLWRLPLGKEYRKQLDSKVADMKNVGGKEAGTITAACYLQEFVGDRPWAHLDIAGTAWNFTKKSYVTKGASGTGVRTLIELISRWR